MRGEVNGFQSRGKQRPRIRQVARWYQERVWAAVVSGVRAEGGWVVVITVVRPEGPQRLRRPPVNGRGTQTLRAGTRLRIRPNITFLTFLCTLYR